MKLIVGLGNPGDEYARTRHNIGRRLVEFIAATEKVKFAFKKFQKAALASVSWNGEMFHLAHPLTYMNLSGEAIVALLKYWKVAADKDLLIVVDDVALPFGKFRLRGEGSSGGDDESGQVVGGGAKNGKPARFPRSLHCHRTGR